MIATAVSAIDRGSFGGHETFPLRFAWLRKAVQHVDFDAQVFLADDAMVRLGVGKNMVRSIKHWGMTIGVVEEDPEVPNNRGRFLRSTGLGRTLFGPKGLDPYLEDPGTLWALHHQLASQPNEATTWYWAFNHLPQPEFTKHELLTWLLKLAQERRWPRVSPASLRRDVEVFLRTYVPARTSRTVPLEDTLDCPLVELGLIREFGSKGYLLQRGDQPTLPIAVFAYGLAAFLSRAGLASTAVPVQAIAYSAGSPGRIFALSEDSLLARLERIEEATDGDIVFHDTAGLRQLLVHRVPSPLKLLERHYARKKRGRVA